MDRCSNCDKEFGLKDRYCSECGTSRVKRRLFYGEAQYCTRCGSRVHSTGESTQRKIEEYVATNRDSKSVFVSNIVFVSTMILCLALCIGSLYMTFYGTSRTELSSAQIIEAGPHDAFELFDFVGHNILLTLIIVFSSIALAFGLFKLLLSISNVESSLKSLHNRNVALGMSLAFSVISLAIAAIGICVVVSSLSYLAKLKTGSVVNPQLGVYDPKIAPFGIYFLLIFCVLLAICSILVIVRSYKKFKAPII